MQTELAHGDKEHDERIDDVDDFKFLEETRARAYFLLNLRFVACLWCVAHFKPDIERDG